MEEKRCLLIKTKENSEKDHLNVWERNLREDFENLAENIVCPFNSPNVALVQFASMKGIINIILFLIACDISDELKYICEIDMLTSPFDKGNFLFKS